jgi:hypothetical protein
VAQPSFDRRAAARHTSRLKRKGKLAASESFHAQWVSYLKNRA